MYCLRFRDLHGIVQRAANRQVGDQGSGAATARANFLSDLGPACPAGYRRLHLDREGFARDDHLNRPACVATL